jgi:hypothetical protein
VSKKKDWKGTEPVARTPEQHKRKREYDAMTTEEKKVAHRKQLVSWLEMFQGDGPIMYMNGKPQKHHPMSKEAADLHLALFDGEIEPTPEVKQELAEFEALRWPESKRMLGKLWKAMDRPIPEKK